MGFPKTIHLGDNNSVWRRFLQFLAVILLTGYSLFSVARTWVLVRSTWNPDLISNDPVSMWQRRIARIKWPDNVGREVGYIADWDIDPAYDPIGQDEEYVLTQYSLAPMIVKRGDGPEWIVGNLTLPGADDWLSQKYPGAKIHYYGWGIYLIHKLEP